MMMDDEGSLERHLAKYFFDVRALGRRVRDDSGLCLHDEAQAIHEATQIVWQLLADASAAGRTEGVSVSIRTESGACVFDVSSLPLSR